MNFEKGDMEEHHGTPRPVLSAEERYRVLSESAIDYAFITFDQQNRVNSWSKGAEQMLGYSETEALGMPGAEFFTPEDRARGEDKEEIQKAIREGRAENERWHMRKDGSRFWGSGVMTSLRNEAGDLIGLAKVMRDLTARRESEERLRASEERFRLLVENVQEHALFQVDPAGRISGWNTGAARIFGYGLEEIVGKSFSILFTPEDRAGNYSDAELKRSLKDGRVEAERWLARKDGSLFFAHWVTHPMYDGHGTLRGFAKVLRDETERKEAEQELRFKNEELTRVNRNLEEFAFVASHDLREPLRMVRAFSERLVSHLGSEATEDQRQNVAFIAQGVKRMEKLIEDLLVYSRAIHASDEALEEVRLDDALDQALLSLGLDDETGKRIVREPLPAVQADLPQIARVFQNLLSNSFKYRYPDRSPEVRIRSERRENEWIVSVQDNGIGFEPEQAERIFGLFKRLHHEYEYPGTGLGLAICRRIVERYGGRMWAMGAPGLGATFFFSLPIREEKSEKSGVVRAAHGKPAV